MTQEEKRYYEIGEASYEWVGERGDTEFRLGAEWADEHPRKGLVDIDEACKWLGKHFYDSKYEFRDDDGAWIDVDLVLEDLKEAMNKPIYE